MGLPGCTSRVWLPAMACQAGWMLCGRSAEWPGNDRARWGGWVGGWDASVMHRLCTTSTGALSAQHRRLAVVPLPLRHCPCTLAAMLPCGHVTVGRGSGRRLAVQPTLVLGALGALCTSTGCCCIRRMLFARSTYTYYAARGAQGRLHGAHASYEHDGQVPRFTRQATCKQVVITRETKSPASRHDELFDAPMATSEGRGLAAGGMLLQGGTPVPVRPDMPAGHAYACVTHHTHARSTQKPMGMDACTGCASAPLGAHSGRQDNTQPNTQPCALLCA